MQAPIPDAVVAEFLRHSVSFEIGRAARMLHEQPELAGSGFPAAVVLGDDERVQAELRRDPGVARRVDPRSGWSALHLACASRFHLDAARAAGLEQVVRLLLESGAEVDAATAGRHRWRPLECAVTSANSSPNNEPIIRLLLGRGAPVRPETIVASLYAAGGTWCLALLTRAAGGRSELFTEGLIEAVAGADPEAVVLLLKAGADPDAAGAGGRSARRRALTAGVRATVELLGGAGDDPVERLLEAVVLADADAAARLLVSDPALIDRLAPPDRAALVLAAERGAVSTVALMLDLGFPVGARRCEPDEDGATALHAASWAGSAETVRLLIERGADLEARDTRWHGRPLEWALVGSGERPASAPAPDWVATVTALLAAGASTDGLDLDPGDPKQPSPEVAELLRTGVHKND